MRNLIKFFKIKMLENHLLKQLQQIYIMRLIPLYTTKMLPIYQMKLLEISKIRFFVSYMNLRQLIINAYKNTSKYLKEKISNVKKGVGFKTFLSILLAIAILSIERQTDSSPVVSPTEKHQLKPKERKRVFPNKERNRQKTDDLTKGL
jgi:hypothetical protein